MIQIRKQLTFIYRPCFSFLYYWFFYYFRVRFTEKSKGFDSFFIESLDLIRFSLEEKKENYGIIII